MYLVALWITTSAPRRRLDEDHLRLGTDGLPDRVEVRGVDQAHSNPETGQVGADELLGSRVADLRRDDVVSCAEQREQRGGDCGHSTRGHRAVLAPFERREPFLEVPRRS
jgi:hypothetical protein